LPGPVHCRQAALKKQKQILPAGWNRKNAYDPYPTPPSPVLKTQKRDPFCGTSQRALDQCLLSELKRTRNFFASGLFSRCPSVKRAPPQCPLSLRSRHQRTQITADMRTTCRQPRMSALGQKRTSIASKTIFKTAAVPRRPHQIFTLASTAQLIPKLVCQVMRFEALHRLKRDRGRNADRSHAPRHSRLGEPFKRVRFCAGFVAALGENLLVLLLVSSILFI
jgi:hypothetical protein